MFSFNCRLCNYPRPAGGIVARKHFDWLPTSPLGHQLVDKLILWTLQGLEAGVGLSWLQQTLMHHYGHLVCLHPRSQI